jgi:hypothetical protein
MVGRGYQGGISIVLGRYIDRIEETWLVDGIRQACHGIMDASRCGIRGDLYGRRVDGSREVGRWYQGGRWTVSGWSVEAIRKAHRW